MGPLANRTNALATSGLEKNGKRERHKQDEEEGMVSDGGRESNSCNEGAILVLPDF